MSLEYFNSSVKISLILIKFHTLHQLIIINTMKEGTVKFFNETKGFGFIVPAEAGEEDVFVHSSGLIDQIRENDKVQYEVERGKKGLNAVNVKVVY
jgi:CspA family cold shock protein